MTELEKILYEHMVFIYGEMQAEAIYPRIDERLQRFRADHPELTASDPADRLSEKDTILITYADMVRQAGEAPLRSLSRFLRNYVGDVISTIHVLPFFPYSSDDGFSVIDYKQVNPDFGDWEDIARLGEDFRLMFDAVVNHISAGSAWFQGFLQGDPNFDEYFTVVDEGADLSRVFRPRATPVLTPFETPSGKKLVWTTFSTDQIDLNFANPEVLLEVIEILLFYVTHGAEFIRLDAVTFIWKEIGTDCINLPRTHRIIQSIRTIFDLVAPKVAVITETNVPHKDNISYFGDGTNEAQMVYNFALPLLTLNSFYKGDVSVLADWASTLDTPSRQATFFNFLAGHDGIGMMPVRDLLSRENLEEVVERTKRLGGNVSYKSNADGSQSPYELNINFLDALEDPDAPEPDTGRVVNRFLAAQSVMLALRGVPGIYFHSLFGSRNWAEGVEQTGRYRTINRQKLDREQLENELTDPSSLRAQVFEGYRHLLQVRKDNPAFHPLGGQRVLHVGKTIFALVRTSTTGGNHTLCLHNVTGHTLHGSIDLAEAGIPRTASLTDIICDVIYPIFDGKLQIEISPYQVLWLKA